MTTDVTARLGLPVPFSGLVKAPYDILADTLRGTRGIVKDRYRRPEKVLAAAERFVPLQIDAARAADGGGRLPLHVHPAAQGRRRVHVGRRLPRVLLADSQGRAPRADRGGHRARPLRRGRLQRAVVGDRRRRASGGSVVWWFDATDMVRPNALWAATPASGNVPGDLFALGTANVEEYVRSCSTPLPVRAGSSSDRNGGR